MATTKGAAIAAPQIFGSDPLEQVFAKGVIGGDPGMSGIAGALYNAAGMTRERHQGTYLDALSMSNKLAAQVEANAQRSDLLKESLKMGPAYANAGIDPTTVPLIGQLYNDPNSELARLPSTLHNRETLAKIAKLNAESQAKHGEGGPKIEATLVTDVHGQGQVQYKVKGGTLASQQEILSGLARKDVINRGNPDPGAATPFKRPGSVNPNAPSARIHNNID